MGFDKKELIKGYQRTIEQNEEKIIEYSKPLKNMVVIEACLK